MSAPPGLGILVSFMLICYCVGTVLVIAIIMSNILRVKLKSKEVLFAALFTVLFFFPCFYFSSLLFRGREDGVTMGSYGYPGLYEGSRLFYGFPAIMYKKFEPYDPGVRNLFLSPSTFHFDGFFINFAFWVAPPIILAYVAKFFWIRRKRK